ncbi:NAD(P)-binding domain-containing protein [Tianweitania aestuarii]|uniref:NAD(P)-binding domain-containing protein n=1 Tax=Tianweitania aestuarii TaxID=2814886 RepID=UPI003265E69A
MKIGNSRGPHTIDADIISNGARAVTAAEAVSKVDVVILSMPFVAITAVAPLFSHVPADTVVIDTANYFPRRDGPIPELDAG